MRPALSTDREATDHIVARHRGLVLRTALVAVLTLVSRLLGFVREMVTAYVFGDGSAVSDAFFTAWRVPNLFRRLLGEGALSTSLQAAITEEDGDRGDDAGRTLFLRTLRLTAWILLAVCGVSMLVVWFLPDRMPVTGWPWMGTDPGPVRDLTLRLMPFVVLVCVTALCGGALFVRGHFAVPNVAPAAMNLVWIVALLWVGARFGWDRSGEGTSEQVFLTQWEMARLLAWGVLVAGLVQLVMHLPPLQRHGLLRAPEGLVTAVEPARRPAAVLLAAAPLAFGAAVYQVNVMIDGLMAEGLLRDGGPTALYYANRVQQFPLALVAIATTNAVFPTLKALGHRGRLGELQKLHSDAQHGIVFLALPAAVGLWVLAQPIASALFEHGNYGPDGVRRIAAALRFLALALVPAGATALVGRAFYALGDFHTPVRVSAVLLVANVGLNLAFVKGLGMDVEGLTLATALSSWANLAALAWLLPRKHALPSGEGGGLARLALMALASALCGASAVGLQAAARGAGLGPSVSLALAAVGAVAVYLALARVLRIRELDFVARRFTGKKRA